MCFSAKSKCRGTELPNWGLYPHPDFCGGFITIVFILLLNYSKFCASVGSSFVTCCKEAWIQLFKNMLASGIWCSKWSLEIFMYRNVVDSANVMWAHLWGLTAGWKSAHNAYCSVHSCKCLFASQLPKHSAQHLFNISGRQAWICLNLYSLGVAVLKSQSK